MPKLCVLIQTGEVTNTPTKLNATYMRLIKEALTLKMNNFRDIMFRFVGYIPNISKGLIAVTVNGKLNFTYNIFTHECFGLC